MSKYEIKITVVHNGSPVGEVIAGYSSLADLGVAMQRVGQALRPDAESWSRWTYPAGEPMPEDGK